MLKEGDRSSCAGQQEIHLFVPVSRTPSRRSRTFVTSSMTSCGEVSPRLLNEVIRLAVVVTLIAETMLVLPV